MRSRFLEHTQRKAEGEMQVQVQMLPKEIIQLPRLGAKKLEIGIDGKNFDIIMNRDLEPMGTSNALTAAQA